jgi:hypothetical protein
MPVPSLVPEDLTTPGTHALVIGVSRYQHLADGDAPTPVGTEFDLEQLSAAARSASEFAGWLLERYRNPAAPLRSLRVLLSPAPGEQFAPAIAARTADVRSAVLKDVEEAMAQFKQAANTHRDNIAIVYVAGHGVQLSKAGAVVLLEDFGANGLPTKLRAGLDVAGLHASMRSNTSARTQFWFVDACRQRTQVARKFESLALPQQFDVPLGDADVSPLFLAATTGKPAYARPSKRTLFGESLLWALDGGAATSPEENGVDAWHVSVTSLIQKLPMRVRTLAQAENAEQSVDIAGRVLEAVFHEFDGAPQADLQVDLAPPEAQPKARATLKLDDEVVVDDLAEWPLKRRVEAGLYLLDVATDAPYVPRQKVLNIKPPSISTRITVTP